MTMLKVTYLYITTDKYNTCMISGFRHQADKNCTLQSYYAVSRGNFLPAFWDNLLAPSSEFKNPKESPLPQNGVYIGMCVGGESVSVVWFQPLELLQVVGWRGVW